MRSWLSKFSVSISGPLAFDGWSLFSGSEGCKEACWCQAVSCSGMCLILRLCNQVFLKISYIPLAVWFLVYSTGVFLFEWPWSIERWGIPLQKYSRKSMVDPFGFVIEERLLVGFFLGPGTLNVLQQNGISRCINSVSSIVDFMRFCRFKCNVF